MDPASVAAIWYRIADDIAAWAQIGQGRAAARLRDDPLDPFRSFVDAAIVGRHLD